MKQDKQTKGVQEIMTPLQMQEEIGRLKDLIYVQSVLVKHLLNREDEGGVVPCGVKYTEEIEEEEDEQYDTTDLQLNNLVKFMGVYGYAPRFKQAVLCGFEAFWNTKENRKYKYVSFKSAVIAYNLNPEKPFFGSFDACGIIENITNINRLKLNYSRRKNQIEVQNMWVQYR